MVTEEQQKEYNKQKINERADFPWKYECGHESTGILLEEDESSILKYLEWKDTVGVDGDKTKCWNCYCEDNA